MSLWSKILLGLIGVAALVCFYLASNALKAEQSWRSRVLEFQSKIEPVETEIDQLEKGGERVRTETLNIGAGRVNPHPDNAQDKLGIAQWQILLDAARQQRGRAWYGVQPGVAEAGTGQITVTIDTPNPHQIAASTVLYVFDDVPVSQGGVYLGEFKVTAVNDQQLTLTPTSDLSQREFDRLQSARGPWTLYEKMPSDSRELFAGLTDDEIAQLIPEGSREAFMQSGKEAGPDAPPEDVVDGKYLRPPIDFGVAFSQLHANIARLNDSITALTSDVAKLDQALPALGNPALPADDPNQTGALAAAYAEQQKLEAELARVKSEIEVVSKHRDALATRLQELQAKISRLLTDNEKLAGEITAAQLRAAGVASPQ